MSEQPPSLELAGPVPVPAKLTSIDDPGLRRRAIEGWHNASQLRRLLDQWGAWFSEWETRGDAHPGFAMRLDESCGACIRGLRRLGADLPSLRDEAPGTRLEDRLPKPPCARLQPVPWFTDEREYERCVNGFSCQSADSLAGELWVWMEDLKASPSTAFFDRIATTASSHAGLTTPGTGVLYDRPITETFAPAKKPTRRRNEGKGDQCLGIYMSYVSRKETPPTVAEIAKKVGCVPGTASRAIGQWEAQRKAMAQEDARERRRVAE